MRPFRMTLILFLIALVAVAGAVYVWKQDALAGGGEATTRLLFADGLPVDDITRIELERRGEATLVFERNGLRWRQVEPFEYPVDPFSMRQFVLLAADLKVTSSLEAQSASLEAMGLDPPLTRLRFHWKDGTADLNLGRRGIGGRAYIRLEKDPAIVVVNSPSLHDRAIEMHPNEWRDRRIFEGAGVDSSSVTFEGPQGFQIVRDGPRWRMRAPVETRLDQQRVDEYLGFLSEAPVAGFVVDQPDDLSPFGLENPVAALSVMTPGSRKPGYSASTVTERLSIGSRRGLRSGAPYYAMLEGRPVVFLIEENVLNQLRAAGSLIDLTASGSEPADVKSIRIAGAVDFTISRDDDDPMRWLSPDFESAEARSEVANALLERLTRMPASRVERRPYPVQDEVAFVIMNGFDGLPIDTVRIARDPESGDWLFNNGDELLRILPSSVEVPLAPEAFGFASSNEPAAVVMP